jgi:hypothetical protein
MKERISGFESFWYILWNIFTLGMPYLYKIIVKKAIIESEK